jgi:hypothetical protein
MVRVAAVMAVATALLLAMPPRSTAEPSASAESGLSAVEILDLAARAYTDCNTYRDSGSVTMSPALAGGVMVKNRFRTAFVRPDRFRFEFSNENTDNFEPLRAVVWRQGSDVRFWWSLRGEERMSSLNDALASGTGISLGAAHWVPSLLLPSEVTGRRLLDLKDAQRLPSEPCGTAVCLRLEGRLADRKVSLWLDSASFLLIRADDTRQDDHGQTVTQTTTWDPVVNDVLDEALLARGTPDSPSTE